MPLEILNAKLTGYMLEEDVFNNQGILLLPKNHVLTASDIHFLNMHQVFSVHAKLSQPKEEPTDQTSPAATSSSAQKVLPTSFPYQLHIKQAEEHYKISIIQLKKLFMEAKEKERVDLHSVDKTFDSIHKLSIKQRNLFHSLIQLRDSSNYLFQHSLHTGLIASTMASLIGYNDQACFEIGRAALLHDIGKVLLPSSILTNAQKGELSEDEWQEWEKHPRYGYELLRKSEDRNNFILEGCLYHHEQLNGGGYPSGLTESKIPLVAQIIAAANLYDNLCAHHAEHKRLSPYLASQELMKAAYERVLNPTLVTSFVYFISEYYTGDYVRLSNGQTGTIIHIQALEPHRPTIQLDSGEIINLQIERSISVEEFLVTKNP